MSGIADLQILLKTLHPILRDGEYVFVTVEPAQVEKLEPIMTFKEDEGETMILKKEDADRSHIPYEATWRLITLSVHSDLQAIGLLAAVCSELASAGISVNAVSAFYHDHLFVLPEKAEEAIGVLLALASK